MTLSAHSLMFLSDGEKLFSVTSTKGTLKWVLILTLENREICLPAHTFIGRLYGNNCYSKSDKSAPCKASVATTSSSMTLGICLS